MALPISIPYSFQTSTTAIPLSQLDANFATIQTAVNSIGNGSYALSNVNITGGAISGLLNPMTVGNGGTGYNSLTANSLLAGNGNAAVQLIAPGTSGNILYSNGTAWTSTAFIPQPGTSGNVITSNGTSWISQAGGLPSVAGNAGKVLKTDGSITAWDSGPNFGTAASATSTAIDFTTIPTWAKRITILFAGVSLSGTDNVLVQIGSGSFTTTGYVSTSGRVKDASSANTDNSTSGFICRIGLAAGTLSGMMTITQLSSTIWISNHSAKMNTDEVVLGGGDISFSGSIDRVRITRTGTNTFDAGTINVMWE